MFSITSPSGDIFKFEFHSSTKSLIFIISMVICVFSSTPEQKQAQDTLASWIKSDAHKEFVLIELRGSQDGITKVIGTNDCRPYNLPWPNDFKAHCEKLLKDQQIFLSCASGNRAGQAKTYLESLGYQHVYNVGGFQSWQSAYPDLTIEYKDTLPVSDLPMPSKRSTSLVNKKILYVQKMNTTNELRIVVSSNSAVFKDNTTALLLTGQLIRKNVAIKKNTGTAYILKSNLKEKIPHLKN